MMQAWKVPHMVKGALTYVPLMNRWRLRRAATGGSGSARYCYAVWLRHLVTLGEHGFDIKGAVVGELGPGDSIGMGLAAVLSGAKKYVGLDVIPYSAQADLNELLSKLAHLYASKENIPGHDEFPNVRPRLTSYAFPEQLIDSASVPERLAQLRSAASAGLSTGSTAISYRAPWSSAKDVESGSLDLIFSQAVLQYVDDLDMTYRAMFEWLKPGGFCSHATGLGAVDFAPSWNGHWAYKDWEWNVVRGRRELLLNREPVNSHLLHARNAGFDVLSVTSERAESGLPVTALAPRFRNLSVDDLQTRGAMFVLRKPQ
jgi:SAM-dependent methyltransferase